MAALISDAMAGVVAGPGPEEELPQKTVIHFNESPETLSVDRSQPEPESDIDTIRNAPLRPQLDKLAESFHAASLQQQRLTHFDYQPFSLPSSRVGFLPSGPVELPYPPHNHSSRAHVELQSDYYAIGSFKREQ
jgi:hypothetical protein